MKLEIALFALVLLAALASADSTFVYAGQLNGSGGRGDMDFNFLNPVAVSAGDDGLVYVGDISLGGVYGLNSTDAVVSTIGKDGGVSEFSVISDVKYYGGKPYIVDRGSGKIFSYVKGSGVSQIGPSRDLLETPTAVHIENGTLWALNSRSGKIIEYNLSRSYLLGDYLGNGIGTGKLSDPQDFDFDSNYIYVADTGNNRVEIFDRQMNYVTSIGSGRGGVTLSQPRAVAVDAQGRIFVSDWADDRIVVFDINSNVLEAFGTKGNGEGKFDNPTKMSFAKNGTLYIADSGNRRIVMYTLNWSANDQNSASQVELANETVQEYKSAVIGVMDRLSVNYTAFSSLDDIKKAYEKMAAGQYGDAKTFAQSAVANLGERRQIDAQLIEVSLGKFFDNESFAIDYYSKQQLPLEQETQRASMAAKLDEAKAALAAKDYVQASSLVLDINEWVAGVEKTRQEG
ncbi:MAG: NHL repeat-containing protein, partial [Candidatus Micrarchaeota archaeon]